MLKNGLGIETRQGDRLPFERRMGNTGGHSALMGGARRTRCIGVPDHKQSVLCYTAPMSTGPVTPSTSPLALALTGASGVVYGLRLLECLIETGRPLYLMISEAGQMVLR
ncbi:MAG: hypothetical protein WCP34_17300, partial [Pseudomonadota bacterium]